MVGIGVGARADLSGVDRKESDPPLPPLRLGAAARNESPLGAFHRLPDRRDCAGDPFSACAREARSAAIACCCACRWERCSAQDIWRMQRGRRGLQQREGRVALTALRAVFTHVSATRRASASRAARCSRWPRRSVEGGREGGWEGVIGSGRVGAGGDEVGAVASGRGDRWARHGAEGTIDELAGVGGPRAAWGGA